jgi:hypothetical protein
MSTGGTSRLRGRRVRHEVADGVRLMAFSRYSQSSWGHSHLTSSVLLAVLTALVLGSL